MVEPSPFVVLAPDLEEHLRVVGSAAEDGDVGGCLEMIAGYDGPLPALGDAVALMLAVRERMVDLALVAQMAANRADRGEVAHAIDVWAGLEARLDETVLMELIRLVNA